MRSQDRNEIETMTAKHSVAKRWRKPQGKTLGRALNKTEWGNAIEQLACDLSRIEQTPKRPAKTHVQIQELLSAYLEVEQNGQPVKELYPYAARHLRECITCRIHYELMRGILEEMHQAVSLTTKSKPLATSDTFLWRKIEFPASRTEKEKIRFEIPPHLLYPHETGVPAFRGSVDTTGSLLVQDEFVLARQEICFQIWSLPVSPNEIGLRLVLSAPASILKRVSVIMQWGRKTYACRFSKKQATLAPFPARLRAKNLTLTIELTPAATRPTRKTRDRARIPSPKKRAKNN